MSSSMIIPPHSQSAAQARRISYSEFYGKVLGAWYGKTIGGTIGAPFEVHKLLGHDVTAEDCWPKEIVPNDDLDIQIVWLEVMEERGLWFTHQDLAEFWEDRCWYNFSEYSFFLLNERRGIHAPHSGRFNNEFYKDSMGCPIRSEIWSIVAIGNPSLAARFARLDGELDHDDEAVWCEQFWAAAGCEAFFTADLEAVLAAGRAVIPAGCVMHDIALEVPAMWAANPDPDLLWLRLNRSYGDRDGSKARINFALQLLSLYAAAGDFRKLMVECSRYGYDVDSTAATVGALHGIMHGAESLPEDWKARLGERLSCGIAVRHKTATFDELARDTVKIALEMIATRNPSVEITGIPADIGREVDQRLKLRKPRPEASWSVDYPAGPVLFSDRPTKIVFSISNDGSTRQSGRLSLRPKGALRLSKTEAALEIPPGESRTVELEVSHPSGQGLIADANLFEASWNDSLRRDFGVSGARQYKVYGPYWDVYDTTKWAENPFRRPGFRSHPLVIPGVTRVHVHNFARLDRPYLDETLLLKNDIPGEDPYIVQCPEDCVTNASLGGFVGEACYYLTREVVSAEPITCFLAGGSVNPFIVWVDGREVMRGETCDTWGFQEHIAKIQLGPKPARIVVKVAKQVEEFKLVLSFMRDFSPNKNGPGVSSFHHEFSDVIAR